MKTFKYIFTFYILLSISACSNPEFGEVNKLEEPDPVGPSFKQFSQVIDQAAEEQIVDLLVVVDNSTSMSTDQEKLSREFASFVSAISDADYRIGVITTDTDTINKENEEGFYGNLAIVAATGKRFIEKSDGNPAELFSDLIKRDETKSCLTPGGYTKENCVSPHEKPLYAIKMAIDKRETVNKGFFREGAALGVVIISDEDEIDFADGTYFSAQNLLDHFKSEFIDSKKITAFVIGIFEGDEVCFESQRAETKSGTATSYGIRIGELASKTGGFFVNICDENFGVGIGNISRYVEKNLLPLKIKVPDGLVIESVRLKITKPNGEPFIAGYELIGNILEISPLPPENSRIELKYKYKQ